MWVRECYDLAIQDSIWLLHYSFRGLTYRSIRFDFFDKLQPIRIILFPFSFITQAFLIDECNSLIKILKPTERCQLLGNVVLSDKRKAELLAPWRKRSVTSWVLWCRILRKRKFRTLKILSTYSNSNSCCNYREL